MPDLIIKPTTTSGNKVKIQDQGAVTRLQTEDAGITLDTATVTTAFTSPGIDDNANATAITIDSDEKVGIGTATPSEEVHIAKSNDGGDVQLLIENSAGSGSTDETVTIKAGQAETVGGKIVFARHGNYGSTGDKSSTMNFYTADDNADNLRMHISKGGNVGIGTATPTTKLQVYQAGNNTSVASFYNTHASGPYGYSVRYTGCSPDGSDNWFAYMRDSTTARFVIVSDGDVTNHDNSYGQTSDERIKQDIKDANSQWNDIKALKVRNFKRKDDVKQYGENAWEQIGVVAQEVESISPKLVKECVPSDFELEHCGFGEQNSDGEWIPKKDSDGNNMTVKSMKYSVLYMKAVKALQEAMERIEQLEAKVTALENA